MSAFKTYWRAYGGLKALRESNYFLLALIFTFLCIPIWATETEKGFEWVTYSFAVLPSMVSFSLGALAIILAFSDRTFLRLLRQKGAQDSYFMKMTSAYFHFIFVQFLALLFAFILLAHQFWFISGIAFALLSYAIFTGIAAAAALLDMSEILNAAGKLDSEKD